MATVVTVQARPANGFPAGYVQLPSAAGQYAAEFPPPPQVTRAGDDLMLRHTNTIVKLGFRPQLLTGRAGDLSLNVARGGQTGKVVAEPDQGFFTQVYLGGHEALIEMEQLSPLFAVGEPASFAVVLQGASR